MFSNFKNVGCVSIEISRDSVWKNYSIILYIIQQISFQVCTLQQGTPKNVIRKLAKLCLMT